MSARNAILDRLRAGQHIPANQGMKPATRDELPPLPTLPKDLWVSRFIELMEANHATVIRTESGQWQQSLKQVLADQNVNSLRMGPSAANKELTEWLQGETPELDVACYSESVKPSALANRAESGLREQLFNQIDAGFSRATAGLAETGSLVVATGPEEPRTVSLVPPLSIVLLNESDLISGVTELMQQLRWQSGLPTNLLFISGPSKTADIQQTLAYGAHGPKALVILLVSDSAAEATESTESVNSTNAE